MSYTANPRATGDGKVVKEGTGMVTSDSLAAESLRSGGDFANQDASYSSQPSYSTTTNTTDTSGASRLAPAGDKTERLTDAELQGTNYRTPAQEVGMNKFADERYKVPGDGTYDTSKGGPQESYGGDAPSYVDSARGAYSSGDGPKGTNLQEGGFDSDGPNASFTQDVGSRRDPGRLAEQSIANSNARSGGDAGYSGAAQGYQGGQGGFENLDREERA